MTPSQDVSLRIAKMKDSISCEEAETILLPLLKQIVLHQTQKPMEQSTAEVTPLMVACDRGLVEVCRFLLDICTKEPRYLRIIGRIDEKSPDSGNTAVHHAAMSGRIDVLTQLILQQEGDSSSSTQQQQQQQQQLASLTNSHGDTPIMMAVVHKCADLLSYWLDRIEKDSPVLQHRNASNDSAISLACGHGQWKILKLLLLRHKNIVQQDDLILAQSSLEKMNRLLNRTSVTSLEPSTAAQLQEKQKDIQQCVDLVRESLAHKARTIAEELLLLNDHTDDRSGGGSSANKTIYSRNNNHKKKKRNKKAKKGRGDPMSGTNPDELSMPEQTMRTSAATSTTLKDDDDYPNKEKDQEGTCAVQLTLLANGTRAVTVPGRELNENTDNEDNIASCSSPTTTTTSTIPNKTVDELFRDQFVVHDTEIQDILEALCLNVSQLLLTPHGMALHLSPSQLDAVDQILSRQRAAVEEAREIQKRLHATAAADPRTTG